LSCNYCTLSFGAMDMRSISFILCAYIFHVARSTLLNVTIQEDEFRECEIPAIQFLQRTALYKAEKLKSAGILADQQTEATDISCMSTGHPLGEVPLSYEAYFQLAMMRELEITSHLRPCHNQIPKISLLQDTTVHKWHHNRAAKLVVAGWLVCALSLVATSLINVLVVPKKGGAWDKTPPSKLRLADEEKAFKKGIVHWLGLSWVDNLMGRYGKCTMAEIEDIELNPDRCPRDFKPHKEFVALWTAQIKKRGLKHASLVRALASLIGTRGCICIVVAGTCQIVLQQLGMVIALDIFLGYMQRHFLETQRHPGIVEDMLFPTLLVIFLCFGIPMLYRLSEIVVALLDGYYTNICAAGLATIVYEKGLELPVGAANDEERKKFDSTDLALRPNIVQVLNIDIVATWGYLLKKVVYYSLAPISSIFLIGMLITHLGLAGLFGMCYMFVAMIFGALIVSTNFLQYVRWQNFTDHRMHYLMELLTHIRVIKSLGYENLAYERVKKARDGELIANKTSAVVGSLVLVNFQSVPWVSMILTLVLMAKFGRPITARHLFIVHRIMVTLLSTLGILESGLAEMLNVPNSFNRIKAFLAQPERPRDVVRKPSEEEGAPVVSFNGTFSYMPSWPPALKDVHFNIYPGEVVAVVGSVGSGKTSLMLAIMGELFPFDQSSVEAPREISYNAQVPWIFEGTLRENVILDKPLKITRYNDALNAAGLMPDLEILPGADEVTIGAQGIRLSGGQKARVGLARAAYMQNTDVMILDDPFASVDVPTGQHIFNELVMGPITEGRTKIVVLQPHIPRLKKFDRVLLMQNGRLAHFGPPEQVIQTPEFQELLAKTDEKETGEGGQSVEDDLAEDDALVFAKKTIKEVRKTAKGEDLREADEAEYFRSSTVSLWVRCGGIMNGIFVITALVAERLTGLIQLNIVALWADKKLAGSRDDLFFLAMSAINLLCQITMTIFSNLSCNAFSISAGRRIHEMVMDSMLKAPVDRFFDKNPVGRLIQRLSGDMGAVDRGVLQVITGVLKFVVGMTVSQTFVMSLLPWWVPVCCIPMYMAAACFAALYASVAVPLTFQFKRGMAVIQELQSQISASNISIRVHGMSDDFMARFNNNCITMIRAQYLTYHVTNAWAASRISLVLCVLSTAFNLGGLWSGMSMGRLMMICALCFGSLAEFEQVAPLVTQFITTLNSLQRVVRYLDIPQEAPLELPGDVQMRKMVKIAQKDLVRLEIKREGASLQLVTQDGLPLLETSKDKKMLCLVEGRRIQDITTNAENFNLVDSRYSVVAVNSAYQDADIMAQELVKPGHNIWLDLWHHDHKDGVKIEFEHFSTGYNDDPDVLKNVSFAIAPKAKAAFVGHSGCGKSTTLLCLLRMLEARRGRLLINDSDSRKMGLRCLRSMVGLVPQDPTIFDGTWRYNMDPFEQYPDGRIWEALRLCRLLPYVCSLSSTLNSRIETAGANLSMGQRQLLSLARMVVRQPAILMLDECTSALDPATQQAVQETLTSQFPLSTIVAVAHRIETILNFDKIVVFRKGEVVEQGTVSEVSNIPDGVFAKVLKKHRLL